MFEYESSESEDKHNGYKSDSLSDEIDEIDQNTYNNLRINLNNNPDKITIIKELVNKYVLYENQMTDINEKMLNLIFVRLGAS